MRRCSGLLGLHDPPWLLGLGAFFFRHLLSERFAASLPMPVTIQKRPRTGHICPSLPQAPRAWERCLETRLGLMECIRALESLAEYALGRNLLLVYKWLRNSFKVASCVGGKCTDIPWEN